MAIKPTKLIWHNGRFVPWHEATVHVLTHGLHYGSSVFEGIRAYRTPQGAAFFRLAEHIDRLFDSARIHRMEPSYTRAELSAACHQLIRVNRLTEGAYLRPIIYRGFGEFSLAPSKNLPIETAIGAVEWGAYLGAESLERGVDACISSWQRPAANTFPAMAKAGGNYLNSQLVSMEAARLGYHEGIALGVDGMLSEGGGENLFLVRKGVIYTPPVGAAILAGITRDAVISLAQDLGYEVRETPLPREALYVCEEAFFTGTACEIAPIRSIDGLTIGSGARGPVVKALQDAFFGVVSGRMPDPHGWLEYVGGGELETEHDLHAALA